jgi:hypothetical protein
MSVEASTAKNVGEISKIVAAASLSQLLLKLPTFLG